MKADETTIEGLQFRQIPFPGRKGLRLFVAVASQLAPLLKVLQGNKKDSDLAGIGSAMQNFYASFKDEDAFNTFINDVVKFTEVKHGDKWQPLSEVFDDIFTGKVMASMRVIAWIIKHNFADFLQALPVKATDQA